MKIEDLKSAVPVLIFNSILLNIICIHTAFRDGINDILKFYSLSKEQYDVLVLLKNLNGKCANMYMIQERMASKTSNTTRLIDKLLLKGLVTRTECNENRRKIDISITAKGIIIVKEAEPKVLAFETQLSDHLNADEIKNLNFLLEKYRKKK